MASAPDMATQTRLRAMPRPGRPIRTAHKNYSRIGREPRKHLMLICRACHQWIHGWHEQSGETLSKITKRVAILAGKKGIRFRQERISAHGFVHAGPSRRRP